MTLCGSSRKQLVRKGPQAQESRIALFKDSNLDVESGAVICDW